MCHGVTIEEQLRAVKMQEVAYLRDGRDSFRVGLLSDPQLHPGGLHEAIARLNDEHHIAYAMVLGDLTELGLSQELAWACEAMRSSRVPILAVIGNHDRLGHGRRLWKRALGPTNYAFSFLGARFVVFDNDCFGRTNCPDLQFIRTAATTDRYRRTHTVAVCHAPISDRPGTNETGAEVNLTSFLADLGVRYSLHGHRHRFSLSHSEGSAVLRYVVSHAGDASFGIASVDPESIAFFNCTPECIEVTP